MALEVFGQGHGLGAAEGGTFLGRGAPRGSWGCFLGANGGEMLGRGMGYLGFDADFFSDFVGFLMVRLSV